MKHRKLRIAWSVACSVVAVLLIVMWVRSYWHLATVEVLVTASKRFYLHSFSGTFALQIWHRTFISNEFMPSFNEANLASWLDPRAGFMVAGNLKEGISGISCSYWLLTGAILTTALLPWLRCQFSLRALLIATTLVAVVLGFVVWLH
jgi:hypothetical protein